MPKKFAGENSKAVQAKARKDAARETEKVKKMQQEEDAFWMDNDKGAKKKQLRKDESEKKKVEQAKKKAETKALLEEEMMSIKNASKNVTSPRLTMAKIYEMRQAALDAKKEQKKLETHLDVPVEENINRINVEGEEARSIGDAISILSLKDEVSDKHPEKRMKAAYNAFEERRLVELKAENPSLRLSQLKQIVFKEWQKSPENPLNN